MKTLFTFITLVSIYFSINAQEKIDITGCVKIEHTDDANWIKRYQDDIHAFRKADSTSKDFSCDVLFVGSSSFGIWNSRLKKDMSPLKVINRSYGGSSIRDILYYYDIVVKRINPNKIILYVENDFSGTDMDISVSEAFDLFRLFEQKIHEDFPGINLYIVSLKPSFFKEKELSKQKTMNFLIKEFSEYKKDVVYIDITTCMYNEKGELKKEIFGPDGLHMNDKGYDLWTGVIKPYLLKDN